MERRAAAQPRGRHVRLRGVRRRAVRLDDEVRVRQRLAELLRAEGRRGRRADRGPDPRHGPRRGPLPAVWLAPRSRVPRRTAADRHALLHEQPGARRSTARAPPTTPTTPTTSRLADVLGQPEQALEALDAQPQLGDVASEVRVGRRRRSDRLGRDRRRQRAGVVVGGPAPFELLRRVAELGLTGEGLAPSAARARRDAARRAPRTAPGCAPRACRGSPRPCRRRGRSVAPCGRAPRSSSAAPRSTSTASTASSPLDSRQRSSATWR